MPQYHLDLLNEQGELAGAIQFESADDQVAKAHAETVLGGHGGKLWRLLTVIVQDGPPADP